MSQFEDPSAGILLVLFLLVAGGFCLGWAVTILTANTVVGALVGLGVVLLVLGAVLGSA